MRTYKANKKLIPGLVLVCAIFLTSAPLAYAQDVKSLVYDRCTECHKQDRWEGLKNTEKQWSTLVDKMVRYGAQLTNSENDLVVKYLTTMSSGNSSSGGTTARPAPAPAKEVANESTQSKNSAKKTVIDLSSTTTTVPPTTTTTLPIITTTTVLKEQAKTGVEMIWYLLGGGMMVGSGMKLRNKDKQLNK